jgi:hypothetical protein
MAMIFTAFGIKNIFGNVKKPNQNQQMEFEVLKCFEFEAGSKSKN